MVLGQLFFVIYIIKELPLGLHSDFKLFADVTSLFSVIDNADASSATLNNDLVIKFKNGPITVKCLGTLIEINKLKKAYFQERLEKVFNPISGLMTSQLKDQWLINI